MNDNIVLTTLVNYIEENYNHIILAELLSNRSHYLVSHKDNCMAFKGITLQFNKNYIFMLCIYNEQMQLLLSQLDLNNIYSTDIEQHGEIVSKMLDYTENNVAIICKIIDIIAPL